MIDPSTMTVRELRDELTRLIESGVEPETPVGVVSARTSMPDAIRSRVVELRFRRNANDFAHADLLFAP